MLNEEQIKRIQEENEEHLKLRVDGIREAEKKVINGMAASTDEAMVAYGFAIDPGYQD